MRELREKQKLKRRLYSTPILAALLVLTIVLIRGAAGVFLKERESARGVVALEAKVVDLEANKTRLEGEIARLKTTEGVNEEIKNKFNVAEPGEHVAIIIDRRGQASETPTSTAPWYKRIWDAIIP